MNSRMIRMLLALFPRVWRARYGEEFAGFLRDHPLTLFTLYDIAACAAREHFRAKTSPRLTDRAETALRFAAEEIMRGTQRGGSIFLGLLREGEGLGAVLLREAGLEGDRVREVVESLAPDDRGLPGVDGGERWRALVAAWARDEAVALGQRFVGTEHILLGLLGNETRVKDLLRAVGQSSDELHARVLGRIAELRGDRNARVKKWIVILALVAVGLAFSICAFAAERGVGQKDGQTLAAAVPKGPNFEKVSIPLGSDGTLEARLISPAGAGPFPAAVLIPGFVPGSENRKELALDETADGDPGTVFARPLAADGIVVLQIPIGSGGLSLGDLASRALAAHEYLRTRSPVVRTKVGIIGQSMGGYVAYAAAARSDDVSFVMTLATPVESIDSAFGDALDRVLVAGNAPPEVRRSISSMMQQCLDLAARDEPAETLRPKVEAFLRAEYEWLPRSQRDMVAKTADEFVAKLLDHYLRDIASPTFRSLIGLDFNKAIRQIKCPALVLFAERDFKVEPGRSSRLAEAALSATGRSDWTVRVIKGADHLFRRERRPAETGAANESLLASEFLSTTTTWLGERLRTTSENSKP